MTDALFHVPTERSFRKRSRALVHVPTGVGLPCPGCGGAVGDETIRTDALFFHGGHGATMTVVTVFCVEPNPDPRQPSGCGWSLVKDTSELRPPRRRWWV